MKRNNEESLKIQIISAAVDFFQVQLENLSCFTMNLSDLLKLRASRISVLTISPGKPSHLQIILQEIKRSLWTCWTCGWNSSPQPSCKVCVKTRKSKHTGYKRSKGNTRTYLNHQRWTFANYLLRYLTERAVLDAHDLKVGTERQLERQIVQIDIIVDVKWFELFKRTCRRTESCRVNHEVIKLGLQW